MTKFTNTETAATYVATVSTNPVITIQGLYSGVLSNIPPQVARRLIESGSNLVSEKPAEPPAPPATEAPAVVVEEETPPAEEPQPEKPKSRHRNK